MLFLWNQFKPVSLRPNETSKTDSSAFEPVLKKKTILFIEKCKSRKN